MRTYTHTQHGDTPVQSRLHTCALHGVRVGVPVIRDLEGVMCRS